MQTVNRFGVLGPIEPLTSEGLKQAMANPDIDHIDVFEGTPENLEKRRAMVGKKFTVSKRFQKTGGNKKR